VATKKEMSEYRLRCEKEKMELKDRLEKKHGVTANPKAHRLFDIAWDYGHAYGLTEVTYHYERLVDLIQ